MNFLAHLYLSGNSPKIMLGNFMADFIRGKQALSFEHDIQLGIKLHKEIDFYTDNHKTVNASKERLWANHRHYSSVIVDIFYDHFLAKYWAEYSPTPLELFASDAYKTINSFDEILPEKLKKIMPYMEKQNWLVSYSNLEGIHQVMQGMARRARFESNMANATEDLTKYYLELEQDFRTFFPQLISHSKAYLIKIMNQQ